MYPSTYRPESICPTTTSLEFLAYSKKASDNYPNPQWGYGRLNLCGTMNELVNHMERGL